MVPTRGPRVEVCLGRPAAWDFGAPKAPVALSRELSAGAGLTADPPAPGDCPGPQPFAHPLQETRAPDPAGRGTARVTLCVLGELVPGKRGELRWGHNGQAP